MPIVYTMSRVSLIVLVILGLAESAIIKRLTREDLVAVRRTGSVLPDSPVEEIHRQLSRLRRDANRGPTVTRSDLNDSNTRGLIYYSGYEVILVMTYSFSSNGQIINSNVYRSNDYGANFTNINSRIGNGKVVLANQIFSSPENSTKVYFVDSTSPTLYVSTDGGNSFTSRTLSPNTIDPLSLVDHPTEEDWVLAHDPTNNALYVSRDLGATAFIKIADKVFLSQDYQWGVTPYDKDKSIIYYNTETSSETSTEVDLYTQVFPYSNATRKEFDPSLGPHDGFLMVDRYIFAQKTINSEVTLWVSADRQPFKQAQIPSTYSHLNYIVDSVKSVQALVIVQHTNNQYNLYMSEEKGFLFFQSLADIKVERSNRFFVIDLQIIESMNYTTHIANQNVRDTPSDTNPTTRTLISFDAGANWNILTPPTDSDSECIQPLCSLHFHMSTSEYWRTGVYSQESAPGIIIAHGATGQSLNDDNTNLFISTDGGSTWSQTLNGTWGVSVLDHGGLIVAARDYHNGANESRTLMYTCNEGSSWSQLTFTDKDIRVFAVITEPGETSTVVSLYGIESISSSWVVVTVNFTNIFPSVCGPDDYYDWIPFDKNTGTGCLLGASVTIERRKPTHCCLNGNTYNREVHFSTCACTEEDFECDYGYKHANGYSGPCVRDEDISLDNPCGNGEITYMQSQGYHKIGGDLCRGGVESKFVAIEAPCCLEYAKSNSTSGSSPTVIASTSSRDRTASIVLGVLLVISVLVSSALVCIFIVICIIKSHKNRGYNRVPISYNRDFTPPPDPPGEVQHTGINTDKDEDEKPLTL